MNESLRKSGIELIGDVPWGKHLCVFYKYDTELHDLLVPYFKAGLENNELCVWITPDIETLKHLKIILASKIENFDHYLKSGQMRLDTCVNHYFPSGIFTAHETLQKWVEFENEALKLGFDGLRASGDSSWATEEKYWINLDYYETEVQKALGSHKMIAVCSYHTDTLKMHQLINTGCNHHSILVTKNEKWEMLQPEAFQKMKK